MSAPFVIFGLPRSRTYWLSVYLSYGHWHCAHDQARFVRSVEDVKSWLSMDYVGSAETGAAPWWRLARHYRPDLKIAVVRRNRYEVIERLQRFGYFDQVKLNALVERLDRALDSASKAPGAISIDYEDLSTQTGCARVFEHCLQMPFNLSWWQQLAGQNLQINLRAELAYFQANQPQISAAAKACAQAQRYVCLKRQASPQPDPDGIVIQEEPFDQWWHDGQDLIAEHCLSIGEAPDAAQRMNVRLWGHVSRAGTTLIMTARRNGRMLGYLTAILAPTFDARDVIAATQLGFFVGKEAAGLHLGRRLQRACIERARHRGATKMYMRAGIRGAGPRLGALYGRMGAHNFGQFYEMDL